MKFTDIGGEIMVIVSTTCTTCYLRRVLGAARDAPYQHGGGDHECCDEIPAAQTTTAGGEERPKSVERQLPNLLTPKEEAGGGEENVERRDRVDKSEREASNSSIVTPKVQKRNSSSKALQDFAEALKLKMKGEKKEKGEANGGSASSTTHSRTASCDENNNNNNNEGERTRSRSSADVEFRKPSRSDVSIEGGSKAGMGIKVQSRAPSSNEAEEAYKRNLLASTESNELVNSRRRYLTNEKEKKERKRKEKRKEEKKKKKKSIYQKK